MAAEENTTYQEIYDSFTWDRPTHFNFANDVVDKWAQQNPSKQALFWVDDNGNEKTRTFDQISRNLVNLVKILNQIFNFRANIALRVLIDPK